MISLSYVVIKYWIFQTFVFNKHFCIFDVLKTDGTNNYIYIANFSF